MDFQRNSGSCAEAGSRRQNSHQREDAGGNSCTERGTVSVRSRIITIQIPTDKIRTVIGPGGKTINKIIEETGVKIDINDDGQVFVASPDMDSAKAALKQIELLTAEVEVGKTYTGEVKRIMNFGAFIEVLPGKEGLLHISKMAKRRVGEGGRRHEYRRCGRSRLCTKSTIREESI